MNKSTGNAVALLVLSLVLFNVYRLVYLLPGDLLRSVVVFAATAGGACCLAIGTLRLLRDRKK